MLKRERVILPAVVLGNPGSQAAPLFKVSHRPRPKLRALGGSSCWSEKNRPWSLEMTLKGHLIHHFVYKRACVYPPEMGLFGQSLWRKLGDLEAHCQDTKGLH